MVAKGSSNVLLSSKTQDEIRRNNKKKSRRSSKGLHQHAGTYTTGLRQDRLEAQEERRLARERTAAAQLEFRYGQSDLALSLLDPKLIDLARKVAELFIDLFPAAELAPGLRRMKAAETDTYSRLTADELSRTGAVNLGVRCARASLTKAFEQLQTHPGSVQA